MIMMTTEDYFAQKKDGTFDLDNILKKPGKLELGESADRVEHYSSHSSKFVAFSEETRSVADGLGIFFNENYAGHYYENNSLFIKSDREHYVKMENFNIDTAVSVSFDGFNEMKFKLGMQYQRNQFTFESGVKYIGSTNYDRIVSNSKHNRTYFFSDYYDVEELSLAESTAERNIVDARDNGLNGLNEKVVVGSTKGTTDLIWDKYSGDTKLISQGRDTLNLGSTTLDDILSIFFGANNQIAFKMDNNKTLTVEGNQLDNIVFEGANIGVDYATQSFYVKE